MAKASSSSSPAADMVRVKDEWIAAAMMDDQMVAEFLLRLKQAKTTASENPEVILPPYRWGVRQRRSRSSRFAGVFVTRGPLEKEADSRRGSPVTPLSWSGGSGSGGCSVSPSSAATTDGFEGTSRQASCSTSAGFRSKRSKKKKTFRELKDEENFLLKERLNLEMEIAAMRIDIKEHSERNEHLKKIKFELKRDCVGSAIESNPEQACNQKRETSRVKQEHISDHCRDSDDDDGGCCFFLLPDLNMPPPSEDDVRTETLYDTS